MMTNNEMIVFIGVEFCKNLHGLSRAKSQGASIAGSDCRVVTVGERRMIPAGSDSAKAMPGRPFDVAQGRQCALRKLTPNTTSVLQILQNSALRCVLASLSSQLAAGRVLPGSALMIGYNHLCGRPAHFCLSAHLLDLRGLLFELRRHSFHRLLLLRDD